MKLEYQRNETGVRLTVSAVAVDPDADLDVVETLARQAGVLILVGSSADVGDPKTEGRWRCRIRNNPTPTASYLEGFQRPGWWENGTPVWTSDPADATVWSLDMAAELIFKLRGRGLEAFLDLLPTKGA